jgi:hypothetical protein
MRELAIGFVLAGAIAALLKVADIAVVVVTALWARHCDLRERSRRQWWAAHE